MSGGLRRVLAACNLLRQEQPGRATELQAAPLALPLLDIEAIERELEATLPYDILALSALGMPVLQHASGVRLSSLVGNYGAYEAGWVAIGSAEAGAMHPELEWSHTDQGVHALDVCISRKASREDEPKVRIHDEEAPEMPRTKALSSFLAERLGIRYPKQWASAWRRAARADAPAEWQVTVVDNRPPPLAVPVTHPKFGAGTIVKELDLGKVEVRFASGETRVLLREFLRLIR